MIVSIRGKIINKKPTTVIIDVGGIGYLCSITTNTYDSLPNNEKEVSLSTYFHVTENSQSLFAFSEETERELFLLLIGVSGIGPKTAIILLSSITPNEFKSRLIAGEVTMLTSLPGIGPKTARRIIVELKDKFVKLSPEELPKEGDEMSPHINDAYNALLSLGFSAQDIRNEINLVQKESDQISTEQIIKQVLSKLQ